MIVPRSGEYQTLLGYGRHLLAEPSTSYAELEDRIASTDAGLEWLMRVKRIGKR